MALIKCPECGNMVSDTANTCIHCGYVLKASPKSLYIQFPKSGDSPFQKATIYLNGVEKGVIKQGQTFTAEILGRTDVRVKMVNAKEMTTVVDTDSNYRFAIDSAQGFLGNFKYALNRKDVL